MNCQEADTVFLGLYAQSLKRQCGYTMILVVSERGPGDSLPRGPELQRKKQPQVSFALNRARLTARAT